MQTLPLHCHIQTPAVWGVGGTTCPVSWKLARQEVLTFLLWLWGSFASVLTKFCKTDMTFSYAFSDKMGFEYQKVKNGCKPQNGAWRHSVTRSLPFGGSVWCSCMSCVCKTPFEVSSYHSLNVNSSFTLPDTMQYCLGVWCQMSRILKITAARGIDIFTVPLLHTYLSYDKVLSNSWHTIYVFFWIISCLPSMCVQKNSSNSCTENLNGIYHASYAFCS